MKSGKTIKSLAFIVCLGAGACGPRIPPQVPPPPPPIVATPPVLPSADCRLISEPGEPIRAVALGEPVNPANAPYPSNDSERLLFRQLYETLVRVDCEGRVRPELATSWKMDVNKHAWIVALRENARFSDGRAVTAAAVVSGWTIGSELRPEVRRLVRSVVAVDDRTLEVTLLSQRGDVPLALAHMDLAIARRGTGSLWPLGTRGASIAPERETPAGLPVLALIRLAADSPSVRFLLAPGRDARDLLDEPVDLLLTRDPKVLDYTARLAPFASVPLAWQRTHVLLTPGRARTARSLSAEEREALAHDAVRGEARGAAGPFWWQSVADCETAASQQQAPVPSTGRLVYDENDATARDLADRLVGLARASGPGTAGILDAILPVGRTYQRAAGLTGEELAMARRSGNDAGYIVALDARPLDSCREMRAAIDNAGWVDLETIVPLVDTRLKAIVRRGRSGVFMEWDGGLLIGDSAR
jgi:Bacterial extracellular solute-binding proteins, family 5 Middle